MYQYTNMISTDIWYKIIVTLLHCYIDTLLYCYIDKLML